MEIFRPQQTACPSDMGQAQISFFSGTDTHSYAYFGAHYSAGKIFFRLWAPRAERVFLCGDFNAWSVTSHPMHPVDGGVWEAVLPASQVREGQNYKYFIWRGERGFFKADPYGNRMQTPPESASVVCDIRAYRWRDAGWLRYREERFSHGEAARCPINIYEMHPGFWKRERGRPTTYGEIAAELISYVKQMGYTHVELMPLAECLEEGNPGEEIGGFYAPTSRYGSPLELMKLIDGLHEAGIGVILDWVPAGFTGAEHGLRDFDGEPLYGNGDGRFDLRRGEVRSFLLSNALYWVREFHADGLRVWDDGVLPDSAEADLLRDLNRRLGEEFPDVMTFGDRPDVGYTFVWNSSRVEEGMIYLSQDPLWRKYHHHRLLDAPRGQERTAAQVLPLSHREVRANDGALLSRIPGDRSLRLANLRTFLTYLMTFPGKKLSFMGNELGAEQEWDGRASISWSRLENELCARHQLFVAELNALYLRCPALWERDGEEGMEWIDREDGERNLYAYLRRGGEGEAVAVVLNFCPIRREAYWLPLPERGEYEEVFNSDSCCYGGEGNTNCGVITTSARSQGKWEHGATITIPPMGAVILRKRRS